MTYTGQLPGYLVEQSHSAIIDLVTFELVQAGIARRKHIGFNIYASSLFTALNDVRIVFASYSMTLPLRICG